MVKPERKIWMGATVKAVDGETQEMEVIANSGQLDRQGEILPVEAIDSAAFMQNPVFMWAHKYDQPPIGKVIGLTKDNGALGARVCFAESDFAQDIFSLYKGGFLNAVSVGFIGHEWEGGQKGKPLRWTRAELLEISAVPIPADKGALQRQVLMLKGFLDEEEVKAVIPYKRTPLAPEGEAWDGPREVREAEVDGLKIMAAWYDSENPDVKAAYKLPHHKASGGHSTVWRAVAAAMAALMGGRGGVDIPAADRKGVYNHLSRHYEDFDKEAPEFRGLDTSELIIQSDGDEADVHTKEGRVLSRRNRQIIEEAIGALQEVLEADQPPPEDDGTLSEADSAAWAELKRILWPNGV